MGRYGFRLQGMRPAGRERNQYHLVLALGLAVVLVMFCNLDLLTVCRESGNIVPIYSLYDILPCSLLSCSKLTRWASVSARSMGPGEEEHRSASIVWRDRLPMMLLIILCTFREISLCSPYPTSQNKP